MSNSPRLKLLKSLSKTAFGIMLALIFFALNGCGNAIESFETGSWSEAGDSISPTYDPRYPDDGWQLDEEIVSEGSGAVVAAGDLVQVHVKNLRGKGGAENDVHEMWIYVGRDVNESEKKGFTSNIEEANYLGSHRLRASLINKKVGTRFIALTPSKRDRNGEHVYPFSETLPFKAVIGLQVVPISKLASKAPVDRSELYVGGSKRTYMTFGDDKKGIELEIEVIRTCKGKFYQRFSRFKQWGYLFRWGGGSTPMSRSGQLKHIAVEAQCESTPIARYEAGPFLVSGNLDSWEKSYMRESGELFVAPVSDAWYSQNDRIELPVPVTAPTPLKFILKNCSQGELCPTIIEYKRL